MYQHSYQLYGANCPNNHNKANYMAKSPALSQFGKELRICRTAGFQLLSVTTLDPKRLHSELGAFHAKTGCPIVYWDINSQFHITSSLASQVDFDNLSAYLPGITKTQSQPHPMTGPLPIQALDYIALQGKTADVLFVLLNFHPFLNDSSAVRTRLQTLFTRNQFAGGMGYKSWAHTVLFAHPVSKLHPEVAHLIEPIQLALPSFHEIRDVIIPKSIATVFSDEVREESEKAPELVERIAAACRGLTSHQIDDALSRSISLHKVSDPKLIESLQKHKNTLINSSGLVRYYEGTETFDDLGGLDSLKSFCKKILQPRQNDAPARPRGVLLLGPPGSGKSAFAKALGKETGRPTVVLDIGALMGRFVGQTEENTRAALEIADACSPCILFVDEIEKALAGANGQAGDSGVALRMLGTILSWLNDHESDVFFIATANDASRLPPEFCRAERFDCMFFLDWPNQSERDVIWRLFLARYKLDADQPRPPDDGWTGAEIQSCCRLASLCGVSIVEASSYVIPVSASGSEALEALKAWADGRCQSARIPGPWRAETTNVISNMDTTPVRRVRRNSDPTNN